MFINTRQQFAIGSILHLRFRLALTGAEINVRAAVCRRERGIGVEVQFLELSAEARQAIERETQMDVPQLVPCPWKKERHKLESGRKALPAASPLCLGP